MKQYIEIDRQIFYSNEQTKTESKMVLTIKNFANLGKALIVEESSKYRPIIFFLNNDKIQNIIGTFSQKEILCIFLKNNKRKFWTINYLLEY